MVCDNFCSQIVQISNCAQTCFIYCSHTSIEQDEKDLIMTCRQSVLFNNGKVWTKKDKDFDVTMSAEDGEEIAELTGIYLLKQLNDFLSQMGEKNPCRTVSR